MPSRAAVFDACDALFRSTVRPSVRTVRNRLGGGSARDITPLVREWWESKAAAAPRPAPVDADALVAENSQLRRALASFESGDLLPRAVIEQERAALQAEASGLRERILMQADEERQVAILRQQDPLERIAVLEREVQRLEADLTLKAARIRVLENAVR
jgi:hypothetical protein